tara:strand:+ start:36 stop:785 length:750 start_codon:yes stop_codon:yes gene_type:complete
MGKYFSVTKKMPIAASKQHAAAFGAGDVLVDWQPIQIPKGSACLRSLTMLVRPKGDATPTDNNFGCDIVFSTTNTTSLGTVNSSVDHVPFPDIIGLIEITTGHYGVNVFNSTVIATTNHNGDNEAANIPIVLTGNPTSGDNVGFDTIYVGIVANGAFDFRSINAVNESDFAAGTQTAITMDGSGMDVREHFAAGDVLHAEDDAVLGTVASIDAATTGPINLTAANTDAIDEDDIIYNLHPITLILGFEK